MRRKIDDKKTFAVNKIQIDGENHYIVRDADYIYIPYILGYGTWENNGLYLAIRLKEIERIDKKQKMKNYDI